jgi:hypothetical protein
MGNMAQRSHKKRVAQDLVSQPLPSNSRVAIQATFYNSLSRGTQRRKFLALIDSGADQIMMPSAIAEALGIDRDRSAPRTSLGVSMDPIDGFVGHLTVF